MEGLDSTQLRQTVFMVAVLDDVDLRPDDRGVFLIGSPNLLVEWSDVALAIADAEPGSDLARQRLAHWMTLARALGDLPPGMLQERLRPVGLPRDHALHPGATWVREQIMGEALELGFGILGISNDPDEVVIPPRGLLEATGMDLDDAWPSARRYLEEMGAVASVRLMRDRSATVRPMGDCDVLTLVGSSVFRTALARADGVGLRAMAAPMRRRGWLDPSHVDSAFARAAAAATEDHARGFSRPVLVTVDGVWEAMEGEDITRFALADPIRSNSGSTEVRFRST